LTTKFTKKTEDKLWIFNIFDFFFFVVLGELGALGGSNCLSF